MAKRITKGNLWGYIQSRPYASISDIRRLFTMDVDGAAAIRSSEGTCYIGLPQDAADVVGQLWHEGRVGLDLNPNIKARVVQGIYPARPPVQRYSGAHQNARSGDAAANPGQDGQGSQESQDGTRKRRRRRKQAAGSGAGAGGEAGTGGGDQQPPV